MRVYVAGSTKTRAWVRRVQDKVVAAGGEITFDWTDAEFPSDGLTPQRGREIAAAERQAVRDADLVILCWSPGMTGALIELGMALAWHRRVVILDCPKASVFWHLPDVTLLSSAELPKWLATVNSSEPFAVS